MFNRTNWDRKSQLSEILTELLTPREVTIIIMIILSPVKDEEESPKLISISKIYSINDDF